LTVRDDMFVAVPISEALQFYVYGLNFSNITL
jgi:hypothetical protein